MFHLSTLSKRRNMTRRSSLVKERAAFSPCLREEAINSQGEPSRQAVGGGSPRCEAPLTCLSGLGGNLPVSPRTPLPGSFTALALKHVQDVGFLAAKRKAVQRLGARPLPHVLTCLRCHGARVTLQRCPILRGVYTIAKSPPCLQPKTNKKLTKLEFDHISSFS